MLPALPVIALLAFAPSVGASGSFKTGTYSGKTSQKVKVGFELANSTQCPGGHGKSKLCIYQLDSQSANLSLACPGGGADGAQELINPAVVASSGVVRENYGHTDVAGHVSFYVKVQHGGKLTGWFEESLSTGGTPACKSGKVTFTARRTGGAKGNA
jgi:hypothetical protein